MKTQQQDTLAVGSCAPSALWCEAQGDGEKNDSPSPTLTWNPENLARFKFAIIDRFKLRHSDIQSGRRLDHIAHPRQLLMFLMRYHLTPQHSYQSIANCIGVGDHGTVLHGCQKTSWRIWSNESCDWTEHKQRKGCKVYGKWKEHYRAMCKELCLEPLTSPPLLKITRSKQEIRDTPEVLKQIDLSKIKLPHELYV